VVVSTPPTAALSGTLLLRPEGPFKLATQRLEISLKPGGVFVRTIALQGLPKGKPVQGRVRAELKMERDALRGEVWVELSGHPTPRNALVAAGAFSDEGGGHVQVRPLADGGQKAISQWNRKGHFLQWSLDVPAAGRYQLLVRYHATDKVSRRLSIHGTDFGPIGFLATRGSGDKREDWDEVTFVDHEGSPFRLERGRQTIRLENIDAHGLDLDYLGFTR
jgi:hypothetical protein